MNITITIPDTLVEHIIDGIMSNFPEASQGSALQCMDWNYNKLTFEFRDNENDGNIYVIGKTHLFAAFALMFTDKWPKGCTPLPMSDELEKWDDWLCNADATDFDAFAQLACLGEVIYG